MEGSCNLRLSLTFRLVALSLFLARGLTASDPQALFEKARALELSGDWAAAEAAYREYLRHTPASPEALSNLGVVLAQQQKYDEAVRFYRRALRLRPSLLQIHLNIGLACYKAGKPSAAVDHFNAYLRHDPMSRQARQLLAAYVAAPKLALTEPSGALPTVTAEAWPQYLEVDLNEAACGARPSVATE